MSSSRSVLLADAALAVRILRRRRRSQRHPYAAAASMEEQKELALVAGVPETRLPTTRPIDRRWDQSRLLLLQNARRTIEPNRTWSPDNGIVFGASVSGTRGYAVWSVEEDKMRSNSAVSQDGLTPEIPSSAIAGMDKKALNSEPKTVLFNPFATASRKAYSAVPRARENEAEVKSDEEEDSVISDVESSIASSSLSNEGSEKLSFDDEDYKPSQDSQDHPSEHQTNQNSNSAASDLPDISKLRILESSGADMDPDLASTPPEQVSDEYPELTYHIPPEQFRNAILSSPSTMAAFWSHKLYNNDQSERPKVLYCTGLVKGEECAKKFLNEPVLGFDLEWEQYANPHKNAIKQNVSLIQIAAEGKIGLFHLAMFPGETVETLMPPSLKAILESPSIIKTGVNVAGDARRLRDRLGLDPRGMFELSHLYRLVHYAESKPWEVNKKLLSLATQVQSTLGLPLKKDDVRVSSWSRQLQTEQTDYAASDAYAGLRVFYALETKRKKMVPIPPRPAYWEEFKPIQLGDGTVVVPKEWNGKRKREGEHEDAGVVEKAVAEEENDDGVFYDAEETLDADGLDPSEEPSSQRSELAHHTTTLALSSQSSADSQPHPSSEEEEQHATTESAAPPKTPAPRSIKRILPTSPEVAAAEAWVSLWRASLPSPYRIRARQAQLRAYALWHEQNFSCAEVAALLGDPPLAMQTVATYIMDALKLEDLQFKKDRLEEVLAILHRSVHGRYKKVLDRMGG